MCHVVVTRDIHVDKSEEGGTLDPQPLRALAARVQTSGKDVEAQRVQMSGQLMTDPGVTTRNLDKIDSAYLSHDVYSQGYCYELRF